MTTRLTKPQDRLVLTVQAGPLERPTGFGVGTAGWDVMTAKLVKLGLIELSPPDEDARVWATITDTGDAYKGRPVYPVGNKAGSCRVGDLPTDVQKRFLDDLARKTFAREMRDAQEQLDQLEKDIQARRDDV